MYDPPKTAIKLRCPAHGGNADAYATAVAGRAARNWAGPENPYADADQQPNLESAADPLNLAADPLNLAADPLNLAADPLNLAADPQQNPE